jgi:hypothetical protein
VREILNASAVRSALDFYHAAFMMHHSAYCEEYELANVLSLVAVEIEPHNADYRWLFAAAKDRMLVAKGLPQLFGVCTSKSGESEASGGSRRGSRCRRARPTSFAPNGG